MYKKPIPMGRKLLWVVPPVLWPLQKGDWFIHEGALVPHLHHLLLARRLLPILSYQLSGLETSTGWVQQREGKSAWLHWLWQDNFRWEILLWLSEVTWVKDFSVLFHKQIPRNKKEATALSAKKEEISHGTHIALLAFVFRDGKLLGFST